MRKSLSNLVAAIALSSFAAVPMTAAAQSERQHRQQQQNTWRDIAIGSGVLGLLGLVKGDRTLFFAGAAGALYSVYRLDQDKKSENKRNRARAAMFQKTSFVRDGVRYKRVTVWQHGKKYYRFVRA